MYHASLHNSIDAPWTDVKAISVGVIPSGKGTSPRYVTVERDGQPFARLDAYIEWEGPFQEVIVWDPFVIIAWGENVHLVEPISRRVQSIACSGYFGRLYPAGERLLIATASELICVNQRAAEIWRRSNLGIDGVIVDRVADGLIEGQAEWDPPGGWRSFRLEFDSGEPAAR